jgi:hypothetical protein
MINKLVITSLLAAVVSLANAQTPAQTPAQATSPTPADARVVAAKSEPKSTAAPVKKTKKAKKATKTAKAPAK